MKAPQKHIASTSKSKSRYYALDEMGIVGTQERKSIRKEANYVKKIGEILRFARNANRERK